MIIFKIYAWLCWVIGMRDRDNNPDTTDDREFITYMLRRQRERWGDLTWYMVVILSILNVTRWAAYLENVHNYGFIFCYALIAFQIWLGLHVISSTYTGRKP